MGENALLSEFPDAPSVECLQPVLKYSDSTT